MEAADQKAMFGEALALAKLFSTCVEGLSLITPSSRNYEEEELLLSQLGIQQARLLIWGDVSGVSSPPASTGITHAIPLHPGALNPEPDGPVYFGTRDTRLDQAEIIASVEEALHRIVDVMSHSDHKDIMHLYGMRHLKKGLSTVADQPALDFSRLEGFREKYTLLLEVAESYPNARRKGPSVSVQPWTIHDSAKFKTFVLMVRASADDLMQLTDVQRNVDRAMKIDIKAFGWHPPASMAQSARDTRKLRILREGCEKEYPEYAKAAQEALDNIGDRWKGSHAYVAETGQQNPTVTKSAWKPPLLVLPSEKRPDEGRRASMFALQTSEADKQQQTSDGRRRSSIFSPKSWRKSGPKEKQRSDSVTSMTQTDDGPLRSLSDATGYTSIQTSPNATRSNSISALPDRSISAVDESLSKSPNTLTNMISRHDQYHGLDRIPTKR